MLAATIGCGGEPAEQVERGEPPADPAEECGLCGGKADGGWSAPEAGSCGTEAMLEVANTASFVELDEDARLNMRAVEGIVATREDAPFTSLEQLDEVFYVGQATLEAIHRWAISDRRWSRPASSHAPGGGDHELQIISDIDRTVLPHDSEAPFPGVVTLYAILEHGPEGDGAAG